MAEFVLGQPVVTREPVVQVDAGLPAGRHVFGLVVEDDDGGLSRPDRAVVLVLGPDDGPPVGPIPPVGPGLPTFPTRPTIPTRPVGPIGPVITPRPTGPQPP